MLRQAFFRSPRAMLTKAQQPEPGYSRERALKINHEEIERYKFGLAQTGTRHQSTDTAEQEDGSVIIRVRKQYNDRSDVTEHFV